jgi:hypothetical protein
MPSAGCTTRLRAWAERFTTPSSQCPWRSGQLEYFYGDSVNAIEIQIWCVLIACLLMEVFRAANGVKKMSFSNMMFIVRCVLMEYVLLRAVLVEPEKTLARMLSRQNRAQAPPTLFG